MLVFPPQRTLGDHVVLAFIQMRKMGPWRLGTRLARTRQTNSVQEPVSEFGVSIPGSVVGAVKGGPQHDTLGRIRGASGRRHLKKLTLNYVGQDSRRGQRPDPNPDRGNVGEYCSAHWPGMQGTHCGE